MPIKNSEYPTLPNWFERISFSLVTLSILLVVLDSIAAVHDYFGGNFYTIKLVVWSLFGVEYLIRIWNTQRSGWSFSRLAKYMTSFFGIIDLIAIIPLFMLSADESILEDFKQLRLLRILAIFKFTRYNSTIHRLGESIYDIKHELIASLALTFFVIFISSVTMYHLESTVQPDVYTDIPTTLYWSIMTITSVGYGDIAPVTPGGRLLASIIAITGVAIVALPTALISASFVINSKKHENELKK